MGKRGISTLVATVLTVLLTVIAVALLWASVQPFLSNAKLLPNPLVQFTIDKARSYTLYDPETGYLSLQVKRGADDDQPPVAALKFILDIGGTATSRQTYNVMSPNEAIVYFMLIGIDVPLNSASLAPIYLINGEEVEGEDIVLESKIPLNPGEHLDKVGEVSIVPDSEQPAVDGMVLFYSFDEEYHTESEIIDQSGAGHSGTLLGDVQLLQQEGRTYASFNGDGDSIEVAASQQLADTTGQDKSVAFWARFDCPIDGSNTNQVPFGTYENYYVLFVDPCQQFVSTELRINYDFPPATPRTLVSENTWHDLSSWEFLAVVFDTAGGEIRIYRNGELVDAHSGLLLGSSNPSTDFYVGTSSDAGGGPNQFSYFKGSLDEFRIYKRVLTAEEIQELYAEFS